MMYELNNNWKDEMFSILNKGIFYVEICEFFVMCGSWFVC